MTVEYTHLEPGAWSPAPSAGAKATADKEIHGT